MLFLCCCLQLEALHLSPDLVVLSPLSRASETGKAYLKRRPELAAVTETWDSSHEMAFGDWDNAMVRRRLQAPFKPHNLLMCCLRLSLKML